MLDSKSQIPLRLDKLPCRRTIISKAAGGTKRIKVHIELKIFLYDLQLILFLSRVWLRFSLEPIVAASDLGTCLFDLSVGH
jgi:hypothetical protein